MTKLILDTHILLWFLAGDNRLTEKQREAIIDPSNSLFMSIASFWEAAIKMSLGKLSCKGGVRELYQSATSMEIIIDPISIEVLYSLENLTQIHRDPFDRIIIATAITGGYTIITCDENIRQYSIPTI